MAKHRRSDDVLKEAAVQAAREGLTRRKVEGQTSEPNEISNTKKKGGARQDRSHPRNSCCAVYGARVRVLRGISVHLELC